MRSCLVLSFSINSKKRTYIDLIGGVEGNESSSSLLLIELLHSTYDTSHFISTSKRYRVWREKESRTICLSRGTNLERHWCGRRSSRVYIYFKDTSALNAPQIEISCLSTSEISGKMWAFCNIFSIYTRENEIRKI